MAYSNEISLIVSDITPPPPPPPPFWIVGAVIIAAVGAGAIFLGVKKGVRMRKK